MSEITQETNKKSIIVITILCLIIFGLVGYIIYDKASSNHENLNTESNENTSIIENQDDEPVTPNENETLSNEQSNREKEYESKDINIDYNSIKTNNYVGFTWDSLEDYTEDKYAINLSINNIMTNNKSHSIKISNYKPGDYSCTKGIEKVISFDGKVFYEPWAQGCYLSGLNKIIVLNNKYVVVYINAEANGWIYVFDENGNEIKTYEEADYNKSNISDKVFLHIDNITDDTITFTGYDRWVDNDLHCKNNKYNLTIEDNVLHYSLVEEGSEIIEMCS